MHEINPKDICPTDLVLDVRTVAEHDKMALTMPHWHVDIAHLNPIKFIKYFVSSWWARYDGCRKIYSCRFYKCCGHKGGYFKCAERGDANPLFAQHFYGTASTNYGGQYCFNGYFIGTPFPVVLPHFGAHGLEFNYRGYSWALPFGVYPIRNAMESVRI